MKTNFDVYKKELKLLPCGTEFGVNKTTQIPYGCDRMNCGECLFNKAGYTCGQCRWKWLGIEYKESIKLSTSEKAFLNEIKSTYDLLYKDNGYLYFGTSINDYVAQAETDNYIKLKLFKDSFLSNLEEKKSYSIKELLE